MKILFAIDPWIYRDSVGNQMFTFKKIFFEAIEGLLREENDVKVLLGEDMLYSLNEEDIKLKCEVFCIPLNELYNIYPNHYIAHKVQFNQTETLEQKVKTKKIVLKYTREWKPDVIISFTTPVSVWRYVYEDSMNLQFENGMFSRSPYPFMCQLDPFRVSEKIISLCIHERIKRKQHK